MTTTPRQAPNLSHLHPVMADALRTLFAVPRRQHLVDLESEGVECPACDGSGMGRNEGSRCISCGGTGDAQ